LKTAQAVLVYTTNDDHRPLLRQGGGFKANMNFWKAIKKMLKKLTLNQLTQNLLTIIIKFLLDIG
jgi:hypothetical protein